MKTEDRKIRGKRDLFLPSSVLYISGLKYANTTNPNSFLSFFEKQKEMASFFGHVTIFFLLATMFFISTVAHAK